MADLTELMELDQRIFGAGGYSESEETMADRIRLFPEGCLVVGDTQENRLVGFLTAERWQTEKPYQLDQSPRESHDPDGEILCITSLGIHPSCQGQGLGERILSEIQHRALHFGCREIRLSTMSARSFYERHSFVVDRTGTEVDPSAHVMVYQVRASLGQNS